MTQLANQQNSKSSNYLNGLLQKNSKASSKALQYVALKNVEISQRLFNGQQLISDEQSSIKVLKNESQNDKKKQKQVKNNVYLQLTGQNDNLIRKVLLIENQNNKNLSDQQKKSPPKGLSQQQRLKFVKQKIKQNKLVAKRKQVYIKNLQQKQKLIKQKQIQQQLKKVQQEKQKKIEEARKKLQIIEKRKQMRIIQNKKTNQILKQKSKQKILADKIHQRFLSNQNLMLDQKKKKLAQLRQIHKPIDRQQIDQHMKKFQQSRLQHSKKKNSQKTNVNGSSQKVNHYYRSMFHQILQKQKKQKDQQETQQQYKIKELKEKGKKYAEEIKTNFKPQIDVKKRDEIQNRIKSSSLIGSKQFDSKLKGMEYLQFAKQYAQKFKKQPQPPQNDRILMRQQANKTQNTDYLGQIRKTNAESRLKRSATSAEDFIKKVEKKNLSNKQKQEQIIQFAQDLERKARLKEKISKIGFSQNIDQEVDKLYISAIEAKIKALQV